MSKATIDQSRLATITEIESGTHTHASEGMSVLDAVSYITGSQFSDEPVNVCPVAFNFVRTLGNLLPDERRTVVFLPLLEKIAGALPDPEISQQRAVLCANSVLRELVPAALRNYGCEDEAAPLEALPILNVGMSKDELTAIAEIVADALDPDECHETHLSPSKAGANKKHIIASTAARNAITSVRRMLNPHALASARHANMVFTGGCAARAAMAAEEDVDPEMDDATKQDIVREQDATLRKTVERLVA